MGSKRGHHRQQDTPQSEAAQARVHTSPDDPDAEELDVWQPERLSLSDGLKKSSTLTKGLYLLILCGTAYLNVTAWQQLPTQIDLRTWFGFSSVTVPSAAYCIVTFLVIVYLVYRDIVNRSLSRRKLFIPLIFYMGNYFMIEYLLESLVA